MAVVSVNEYVTLDGNTSGYTRSSPLAGTFAVAANEQHVSELRSSVSCGPQYDGFVDAWTATVAPGGPVRRTVRQKDPPLSVIAHSGSPSFTSIVVD
jgi:hypothetical protein